MRAVQNQRKMSKRRNVPEPRRIFLKTRSFSFRSTGGRISILRRRVSDVQQNRSTVGTITWKASIAVRNIFDLCIGSDRLDSKNSIRHSARYSIYRKVSNFIKKRERLSLCIQRNVEALNSTHNHHHKKLAGENFLKCAQWIWRYQRKLQPRNLRVSSQEKTRISTQYRATQIWTHESGVLKVLYRLRKRQVSWWLHSRSPHIVLISWLYVFYSSIQCCTKQQSLASGTTKKWRNSS